MSSSGSSSSSTSAAVVVSPEHAQARLDAIQSFSSTQIKWISLLPIIPAIMSIIGSLCIIKDVVVDRRRKKTTSQQQSRIIRLIRRTATNTPPPPTTTTTRTTTTTTIRTNNNKNNIGPYERMMLSMSLHDILYTVVFVLSPFLTNYSDQWWRTSTSNNSVGSSSSTACRIMGTLFQYSLANQLYYGMLSYYFVLTIRFHISKRTLTKHGYELAMHTFAIGWPLITAIWGAIVDWYGELEFFPGCWIDNYPKGCIEDECLSPKIAWIVSGSATIFTVLSLIVNYVLIACYVRRRYSRYDTATSRNRNHISYYFRRLLLPAFTTRRIPLSSSDRTTTTNSSTTTTEQQQQQQQRSSCGVATTQRSTSLLSNEQQQQQRSKFVSTQACLYIATYFITYLWFNLLQIVEGMNAVDRANFPAYPFMILQAIFSPLAGFWNCLIYFRPRYIQNKQKKMKMMIQLQQTHQKQQQQQQQQRGAEIVEGEESGRRSSSKSISNSRDRRRPEQRTDDHHQYHRKNRYNVSNNHSDDDDENDNDEAVIVVQSPVGSSSTTTTTATEQQQWISGHFLKRMATMVSSGEAASSFWTPSSSSSSPSSSSSSSSSSSNNNNNITNTASSTANDVSSTKTIQPADKPDDSNDPTKKKVSSDPSSSPYRANRSLDENECVVVYDQKNKNCQHHDVVLLEAGMAVLQSDQKVMKEDGGNDVALSSSANHKSLDQHGFDDDEENLGHRIREDAEREDDVHQTTNNTSSNNSTATVQV